MADSFQATVLSAITGSLTRDLGGASTYLNPTKSVNQSVSTAFTTGTGANQIDKFFEFRETITTNTSYDLDAVTGAFGQTADFAKVRFIMVIVHTTTVGISAKITGDFATTSLGADATVGIIVKNGGVLLMVAPSDAYTVTATSADVITITSVSGGSMDYSLIVGGTSA